MEHVKEYNVIQIHALLNLMENVNLVVIQDKFAIQAFAYVIRVNV